MRVCVIGGGPAGLVTAKVLLEANWRFGASIDVQLFEAEDQLGGTFRYRSYENGALVSSKQLTSFSDFRLPLDHPDHLTLTEYVAYLERYADAFDLRPHIRLATRVLGVRRGAGGRGHLVSVQQRGSDTVEICEFDAIAVCSGLHVTPAVPDLAGIDHIPESFHSAEYKTRSQLAGKRVLVLGAGETGHDIAYEAVKAGCPEVVMCHRDGFLSFPKILNDFTVFGITFEGQLPIDGLITNLWETAHVHRFLGETRLRWKFSDRILQRVLWFLTGTGAGCDQWVGELPKNRLGRAHVFLNKSSKAMPYLNKPYKPKHRWMEYIAHYKREDTDDGDIDLAPWPSHVLPSGRVIFRHSDRKEGKRMASRIVKPEVVVFATGYRQDFLFLDESYARPKDVDVRSLFKRGDESVAFLGMCRPGVGAIPPIAEQQAMMWTLVLLGRIPVPTSKPHYALLQDPNGRITYGVDHGAYQSQLARDMGAEPDLFELVRVHGFFIAFVFAFGAAFVPFYRLLGPWRSDKAPEVVRTELWDTIKRRGLLGNLAMGVVPMVFYGFVNLVALALEATWLYLVKPVGDLAGLGLRLPFGLD